MEDDPLTLEEQKQFAFNNYVKEQNKLSETYTKKMNQCSIKSNITEGLISGAVIGTLFGILAGQNVARVPVCDANNHVVEYNFVANKMPKPFLTLLAGAVILALGLSGAKTVVDVRKNRRLANQWSTDTFNKLFEKSLGNYQSNNSLPLRVMNAGILIINNMPETELKRLHELAVVGLGSRSDANIVHDNMIKTASCIISNFIRYNPELERNVQRIIMGQKPNTYFLTNLQNQKTR